MLDIERNSIAINTMRNLLSDDRNIKRQVPRVEQELFIIPGYRSSFGLSVRLIVLSQLVFVLCLSSYVMSYVMSCIFVTMKLRKKRDILIKRMQHSTNISNWQEYLKALLICSLKFKSNKQIWEVESKSHECDF